MKFLGLHIFCKNQQSNAAKHLHAKLDSLLHCVDNLPLRGAYKFQIYDTYITACLRFDLTVSEVSHSQLENLDRKVRKHLRKWSGMIPSAHTGHLFHSKGLNIQLPSMLYVYGHASTLIDDNVQDICLQEAREITMSQNTTHQADIIELCESASSTRDLKRLCLERRDSMLEQQSQAAVKEGKWYQALSAIDSDILWKSCILGLSPSTYSFALRSLNDTLPNSSNLLLWNKSLSDNCKLCGQGKQTLLHVLNFCRAALGRYTWRHDNVALILSRFIRNHLSDSNDQLLTDVVMNSDETAFDFDKSVATIPQDIYQTTSRPDIVIFNRILKTMSIIELTIPHESNLVNAKRRKAERYQSLIAGLDEQGIHVKYSSLEIGSRGIIGQGSCKLMRDICGASSKEVKILFKELSQIVIKCSYIIFKERDNTNATLDFIMS